MKNRLHQYISHLFIQPYDGTQGRLANQLIYSQLKNRLTMMTQKPSSMLAKWKYSGVIPLFLLAMLIFSFRPKENNVASTSNTAIEEQAAISIDDNTEQPLFPGCEKVNEMEKVDCSHKKVYEYVADHLQYPEEMKKNKVEGKVYVKFVITNNGFVADVRIQKSLHPAADKAALDVVNGMNDNVGKWTPGTKEGRPVTMDMVLPISFVLGTTPGSNSGNTTNSNTNNGSVASANAEVFSFVEEMPRFPGCEHADASSVGSCASGKMYKYIAEHISYPKEDWDNGKEGTVYAKFVVQADGLIANATIARGVSPTMDAEVLRMINSMNTMSERWIPGKNDGKPVAVEFTLPVKFVIPPKTAGIQQSPDSLHISPNPASEFILVELFEGAQTLLVFTVEGVQIAKIDVSKSGTHHHLDVSKYPAGQYSVALVSNKESRSGTFIVIK